MAGPISAQQPLDLRTALQYALDNHASIKIAETEIAKGNQMVREALSTGLPQVSANASILNNLAIRTSLVPAELVGGQVGEYAQLQFGTNWNANAGVQLDQMVFSKTWLLGVQATRELTGFYRINVELSKEEVAYEVAKLYFQVQLIKTQRGLLLANLTQINGLLGITENQFLNGFAKKIDVDRLRVQQANMQTQLNNLDLHWGQMQQALKYSMQMPLETEIELTDSITESILLNLDQPNAQPYFSSRPMLGLLKKQQELYSLDERRWKAGYFPTLGFFANYSYEWQANNFNDFGTGRNWTDFSQVGLSINVPLFDGFFKNSKIQTAQLNRMQKVQEYSLVLLGYQLQYEAAATTMQVNRNNLASVKATVGLAEEVYRVSERRFKEGVAPITELLDAERSLREAQSNLIITLAQIKLAEIDLLHANGQLLQLAE